MTKFKDKGSKWKMAKRFVAPLKLARKVHFGPPTFLDNFLVSSILKIWFLIYIKTLFSLFLSIWFKIGKKKSSNSSWKEKQILVDTNFGYKISRSWCQNVSFNEKSFIVLFFGFSITWYGIYEFMKFFWIQFGLGFWINFRVI
jgi:hypothetical protein